MKQVVASKDKYVVALMHELSPYIVGLGRGKLKYTYLLEPYFSATVGMEVFGDKICLGFHPVLFNLMREIRFFGITYIKNHSALFIVVDMGDDIHTAHPLAFRIYVRKERVKLLEKFNRVHIVKMLGDNDFSLRSRDDAFTLDIRPERKLVWEDY